MSRPTTLREALIIEALGETDQLIRKVEALGKSLDERGLALALADTHLRNTLEGFEARMAAITENAKTRTVQYMTARAEDAGRQLIEQQSRAMGDAARAALGAEIGIALDQLRVTHQARVAQDERPCEQWLLPLLTVATSAAASAATWIVALHL